MYELFALKRHVSFYAIVISFVILHSLLRYSYSLMVSGCARIGSILSFIPRRFCYLVAHNLPAILFFFNVSCALLLTTWNHALFVVSYVGCVKLIVKILYNFVVSVILVITRDDIKKFPVYVTRRCLVIFVLCCTILCLITNGERIPRENYSGVRP